MDQDILIVHLLKTAYQLINKLNLDVSTMITWMFFSWFFPDLHNTVEIITLLQNWMDSTVLYLISLFHVMERPRADSSW